MQIDMLPESEERIAELVGGIVRDFKRLLRRQVALFKAELRRNLVKVLVAAGLFLVGITLALAGIGLLVLMAVNLLATLFGLPAWGSYGIVGGTVILVGVGLVWAAKMVFSSFKLLPVESARSLKDNLRCFVDSR